MPTIIYAPNAELQQIDDFPEDCERSVKGSLHVRPGASATVSDAEAAHLKKRGVVFRATGEPSPKKSDAAPEGAAGDQPAQGVVAPSAGLLSADTEQETGKKGDAKTGHRGSGARTAEETTTKANK